MSEKPQPIGYVSASRTPSLVEIIASSPVPIGTYVYAEFDVRDRVRGEILKRRVIGIVTNASYQPAIPMSVLALAREEIETARASELKYSPMTVYVIADISEKTPETPTYPIPPNTPVYSAHTVTPNPIERLYRRPDPFNGLIRIGTLARVSELEIAVDVNRLYKHLLIAGATGSGKSNAVAVLVDRMSELGAPVIIFDVHGEYINLVPESGDMNKVVVVEAKIDPLEIRRDILIRIIIPESGATRQRRLLKEALRELYKEISNVAQRDRVDSKIAVEQLFEKNLSLIKDLAYDLDLSESEDPQQLLKIDPVNKFHLLLLHKIKWLGEVKRQRQKDTRAIQIAAQVEEKYEEFIFSTPIFSFDAKNPLDILTPGKIVVYDVSPLPDQLKSWVLKLLAEDLLERLKSRYREKILFPPTILVVEEAPLFISRDSGSYAKESLRRFAREGRKFGGVLVVVSQRPRVLDPDISSQIQNYLFLKLVQEEDIKTVMNIADNLEESLARTLPTLPTGWGVLMGEWIGRFPALVAVDKHQGKRLGASPDLVSEWRSFRESFEKRDLAPSRFEF
ncbi:MAG: ATP-binding protein [Sulfolobales archaeon]